jgi:hypothetical protein
LTARDETAVRSSLQKQEESMSFKMISILSIWSDFHVDDRLESEVVRVIIEKVVEIREQSIKKAT